MKLAKIFLYPLLAALSLASYSANIMRSDDVKLIEQLYKNFPFDGKKSIMNESVEAQEVFFTSGLTNLLQQDQACRKKGEICNLDFDPIYSAQDMAKGYRVTITEQNGKILAKIVKGSININIYYVFASQKDKDGKIVRRIDDIIYDDGDSLRHIFKRHNKRH